MRDKILEVKITDYLKIYEKFKDVKEVKDYIDDVILLRHYCATRQYPQMQDHIRKLMSKYSTFKYVIFSIVLLLEYKIKSRKDALYGFDFAVKTAILVEVTGL